MTNLDIGFNQLLNMSSINKKSEDGEKNLPKTLHPLYERGQQMSPFCHFKPRFFVCDNLYHYSIKIRNSKEFPYNLPSFFSPSTFLVTYELPPIF